MDEEPRNGHVVEGYVLTLMKQDYQGAERYLIVLLTIVSVMAYYPVIYALIKVHKNRGFDVIINIAIVVSQLLYKTARAFKCAGDELFLSEDGWHKMLNITLLI